MTMQKKSIPTDRAELRRRVLQLFADRGEPLLLHEIARAFSVSSDSDEYELVRDVILELAEEGTLVRTRRRRYALQGMDTVFYRGRFVVEPSGANYVETGNPEMPRIIVRRRFAGTALHGDIVEVRLLPTPPRKPQRGEVVRIIERSEQPIAGTLESDGSFYFVVPDEEVYPFDFLIAPERLGHAKPGDKVLAHFVRWTSPQHNPEAEIIEVLGRPGRAQSEFESIYREFQLPEDVPHCQQVVVADFGCTVTTDWWQTRRFPVVGDCHH